MGWNHIILEGFCAKNWDYNKLSSKFHYKFDKDKDIKDWEKTPNPHYDPEAKKPEWPDFCKKRICYTCYKNDCQYLAVGQGRWKDILWVVKQQKKKRKKGKK